MQYSQREVAIRLFITCWLIYSLHFATNTVREIYPALSLGDHLSFDVSEYAGLHPDIFTIPGRGTFINNNPGASILGAIPYALTRPVINLIVNKVQEARITSGQPAPEYNSIYPMVREFYRKAYEKGYDVKFGLAAGVMVALLMAPLSALSVVVMFSILSKLTGSLRIAGLVSLLYAFATPVFYRTAQLNHNLLISDFAFFAFAILWNPWKRNIKPRNLGMLLAGLLVGWTFVLDYSGIIVVVLISLYALYRWILVDKKERSAIGLVVYAAGVLFGISVLIGYQWIAFGNPIYPAQHYMPQTQYSVYGYNGMDWPRLDLLWQTAFDIRYGLFLSAPILMLVFYVPAWLQRKGKHIETTQSLFRSSLVGKAETWFILVFTVAFFLFTAANQFSQLQFNSGVRHVVPVTPFLFLIVAEVLLRLPRWLAAILGIGCTYWSWSLAMYRDVEQGSGVFESLIHITTGGPRLPWLTTLQGLGFVSNPIYATLLLVLCAIFLWALWKVRITHISVLHSEVDSM